MLGDRLSRESSQGDNRSAKRQRTDRSSSLERLRTEAHQKAAAYRESALIEQLEIDYLSKSCRKDAIQRLGDRFLELTVLNSSSNLTESRENVESFPSIASEQCSHIQAYIASKNQTDEIKALAIMHTEAKKKESEGRATPIPCQPQ